jgi:glycerol uptake facilitator protein
MEIKAFIAEFIGTAILLFIGNGVVANVSLKKTYGYQQSPILLITFAWGFAVFVAVFITSSYSGAHLNPAVTLGLALVGKFSWNLVFGYFVSQLLGAMLGSLLTYIFYIDHYKITEDENTIKSTFCTSPAIRNYKNNIFSEAMGTFMLVFGILFIANPNIEITNSTVTNFGLGSLEALPVGILVIVIGMSLGGTTGYAINPARDFGPRLIYALLPRKKNKNPDWKYALVPVVGPFIGAAFAAFIFYTVNS